jgi:hypothetical protein
MSKEAKKIWEEKVDRYRRRGQKVDGFQNSLRQYCELEAALIKAWKHPDGPPMAMVTAHRLMASEFYDTPASHRAPAGGAQKDNPFARNGKPAASA